MARIRFYADYHPLETTYVPKHYYCNLKMRQNNNTHLTGSLRKLGMFAIVRSRANRRCLIDISAYKY